MNPHFVHAVAHRLDVAGMAQRQVPQPGVDPGNRAPVSQKARNQRLNVVLSTTSIIRKL